MAARRSKRGFIAPQTAAALSTLDFAAASQAFRRALAVAHTGRADDDATDAASDVIAEMADRMLSIPVTAPADIAEKVVAYGWMNTLMSNLSDPAQQHRIAASSNDAAKGLLAIYLDLSQSRADFIAEAYHPEWDKAVARFEAAQAEVYAVYDREDDSQPTDEQNAEYREAVTALTRTRAPNAKAMAYRLATLIESQFTEAVDDSPTNPVTISRMLADDPIERGVAAAYQDALALAGETGPLVDAQPDPFDPETWLADIEAATGTRFVMQGYDTLITAGRGGADLPGATAAYDGLILSHHDKVSRLLKRTRYEAAPPPAPTPPTPPEELRAMFLDAYLSTFPQGERDAILARLAPAAAPSPELADLISEARAAHVRFEAVCDRTDCVKATEEGREVTDADEAAYTTARDEGASAVGAVIDYRPLSASEMALKAGVLDREEVPTYLLSNYDAEKTYRLDAEHLASLTAGMHQ